MASGGNDSKEPTSVHECYCGCNNTIDASINYNGPLISTAPSALTERRSQCSAGPITRL